MVDSSTVPKTQRAFVLPAPREPVLLVKDHPVIQPDQLLPGQCLVHLTHTGVCHSDLSVKNGAFPNPPKANLVGGHEGIGTVVAIGAHTTGNRVKVGDRVGLKFFGTACLNCEMCLKGCESYCPDFKSHGNDLDGTFCEYAVSDVNCVTSIPDGIDSAEAASIMCAGITVYASLRQSGLAIGDWLVISGAGGGLGHLAIQYAVAMGLQVVAIDTGTAKRDLCLSLGATVFFNFQTSKDLASDVLTATKGGAHGVMVTAGSSDAYKAAAAYLRPRGTILVVGLPSGAMFELPIILLAGCGLTVRGTLVGGRREAIEAVGLAVAGKVKVQYTLRGLSELNDVFEEMSRGEIVGRVVLDVAK